MGEVYKGIDNHFIICDICGFKFRVKDVVQVTNRYDPHYKMIVCKKDLDDTNPQSYPFVLPKENFLTNPTFVRPESDTLNYIDNPLSDILPSAPRNLVATLDGLNNYILLTWEGPIDVGSSPILGYRVEISVPQYASYEILVNSTNLSAGMYIDSVTPITTICTYRVAAISELGLGPYSNDAPFPGVVDNIYQTYIGEDDNTVIASDNGYFLIEG